MLNQTNTTEAVANTTGFVFEKLWNSFLWVASHPIWIPIIIVLMIIAVLLYTVVQNKADGVFSGFLVSAVVLFGIFIMVVLFFTGLKMGHYESINNWAAGLFNETVDTVQQNITNTT